MLQLDGDARRRLVGWLRVPDGFLLSGGGSQPQTGAGSQMVLYLQSMGRRFRSQVARNSILKITQPMSNATSALCPRLPVFMVGLSSSQRKRRQSCRGLSLFFPEMGGVESDDPEC